MSDDRYQHQPRYIQLYRWWRHRPVTVLQFLWWLLKWSLRGMPLPTDDFHKALHRNRVSVVRTQWSLAKGGAQCRMRHLYGMDEVRQHLGLDDTPRAN